MPEKYRHREDMWEKEKEDGSRLPRETRDEEKNYYRERTMNLRKEETERERENRIRSERRDNKHPQEETSSDERRMEKEKKTKGMDNEETYKDKDNGDVENARYIEEEDGSDTKNRGEQSKRVYDAVETRGLKRKDKLEETQDLNKSTKRKLEINKEEKIKNIGREDEEEIRKEGRHREGEERDIGRVVREKVNTWRTKEKNSFTDTDNTYKWESNREEYLITVALDKGKTSSTKKGNLIKIYNILLKTGVRFESLKIVGFGRAEVKYRSSQDANKVLTESRLKPAGYTTYIPPRWKMRKGVIHEWEGSIEQLENHLMPDQGEFTLERLKKEKDEGWQSSVGFNRIWPCMVESRTFCRSG